MFREGPGIVQFLEKVRYLQQRGAKYDAVGRGIGHAPEGYTKHRVVVDLPHERWALFGRGTEQCPGKITYALPGQWLAMAIPFHALMTTASHLMAGVSSLERLAAAGS